MLKPTALSPASPTQLASLQHLPLERVRPDPAQARRSFEADSLRELALSIQRVGLIHPIAVRPSGDGWVLVSGERRLRAYALLAADDSRFAAIPAVVQERSDKEAQLAGLVENVAREDLNPIERAEAVHALKAALRTTWQGVAKHTGLSLPRVQQLAGLTSLRKDLRDALRDGSLGERQVRAVHALGKGEDARRLLGFLQSHPEMAGEQVTQVSRLMKRHPGLGPTAALELLRSGSPAARLPPLPPPLDTTPVGRAVATLRGLVRNLEAMLQENEPDHKSAELVQLCGDVGELGQALGRIWDGERTAE